MRATPLTFPQLAAILSGRRRTVAVTWAATVALAVAAAALLPRQYKADAAVVLDVRAPELIATAGGGLSAGWIPGYVATQADVLGSERVLLQAVDTLRLADDPALRQRWLDTAEGRGDLRTWIAAELRRSLDVRPARESNALYVAFADRDPARAAEVVNAVVDGYIDLTVRMRTEPSREFTRMFDERSAALQQRLAAAQAKLSAFQRDNGIVATEERFDAETARLNELTQQLAIAQGAAADAAGRSAQAAGDPMRAAEVQNSVQVATLSAELDRQQVRLRELTSRLGDAHPQVIEARGAVAELRVRLAAASAQAGTGLAGSASAGRQRVAALEAAVADQRARVLRMKALRDDVAVLQREVDDAQKSLDFVRIRGTQASLESGNTQAAVTVLARATPPVRPSSPRPALIVALAVVVGGLLGAVAALLREATDRRLRTVHDIEHDLQVPLFGTLVDTAAGGRGRVRLPAAPAPSAGPLPAPALSPVTTATAVVTRPGPLAA